MKGKFLKQAQREYSPGTRSAALVVAGLVFLGLLPGTLIFLAPRLDRYFALPALAFGAVNAILGGILTAAGFLFAWWSIYVQFTIGRGTPVPIMATQELIIQPPYSYCRNPMALGTIAAYLGIAILVGSISAAAMVIIGAAVLLTYIKTLEEKEMVLRFGDSYRTYRSQTPFIIPRLRRRK